MPESGKRALLKIRNRWEFLGIIVTTAVLGSGIIGCFSQNGELLALEITSPQNRAEITEDLMTVSGIVSPPSAIITVGDHEVATSDDGTFATGVNLEYGENNVSVTATLEGQEPVTKNLTVIRVLDLEITSPLDKAEVAQSPIIVRGIVSDPAATVTVNGRQISTGKDGTFYASVELNYVKNSINVTATVDGQTPVVKTLTVTRILVLELDSPSYITELTEGVITVSGTVYPPSAVVTVNGVEIGTTKDGSFSTNVKLGYGENTITVSATDPVSRTVIIKRTLTLEITSPEDAAEVNTSPTIVSGIVSDPEVTVTVNDNEVEVAADGTFSTPVEIDYGKNTITVVATPENWQPVIKMVDITRILTLKVVSPQDNTEVTENPVTVKGIVSDPTAIVTVNGLEVTPSDNGTFSAQLELEAGENDIVVSATVAEDAPITKTVTVSYLPPDTE
jgi:flagellar hook assembly protein FlgD